MIGDEEDHDGAGVDDDLGGGKELRAEREVEDGQRHHDHDERKRAVDGVALQQQVDCACGGKHAEDDEEGQLHTVADRLSCWMEVGQELPDDCKAGARNERLRSGT